MTDNDGTESAENRQEEPTRLEREMDEYPLRNASEDPRWALWIVLIWLNFALSSVVFILVLIVLGFFYD